MNKASDRNNQPDLFTLVNPTNSGLYFINEVQENESLNILTYEYLYNGSGVAIGDVNADGLPDVFMGGNFFGGRLFLNQGNLKFDQISERAGVFTSGFTTGVSMVDINHDGYDDIYLCRSVALQSDLRANVLLINNQDNTFTDRAEEYGLADASFSHHASFFDYDLDGDLDLYLLNHRIDFKDALTITKYVHETLKSQREQGDYYQHVSDRLYRNNGDLTFSDVTKEAGLLNRDFSLSATISDINNDGWPDVHIANDYMDKDHFYINNGDGTFIDRIDSLFDHMSRNSMGTDIADMNNDGLMDLVSLDMMPEDNFRQKQLMGPFNYDLYHLIVNNGFSHQTMRNTLQLNRGNGSFSEIGQLAGISHTDWSWGPLFMDFDNDGNKDLFISNGLNRDMTDMDYLKYSSNEAVASGATPLQLVQLMPSNPVPNYFYQNQGNLKFEHLKETTPSDPSFSNGTAYADLDQDGDLDLIVNNFNSEAFLYQNQASKNSYNYLQIKLEGPDSNSKGLGTRVTLITSQGKQVQELNPYRGFLSSSEPLLHFGLGSSEIVEKLLVEWPGGTRQILETLTSNQRITLKYNEASQPLATEAKRKNQAFFKSTTVKGLSNYAHQEDDFIDFKLESLLEHQISAKGPFLTQGDVNGDGLEDIFVGGAAGFSAQLFLQKVEGSFSIKAVADFEKDAELEDGQAVLIDVDQDGDKDLYVTSCGYSFPVNAPQYQDRLYLNDGKGGFSKSTNRLPISFSNGHVVAPVDINQDGDMDLFIGGNTKPGAYPLSEQSQLLINENGIFDDQSYLLPNEGDLGMINDAIWIDINRDGSKELIVAGEWMPVSIYSFEEKKLRPIENNGLALSSGWWNQVISVDIDQDGDMDLIGGNRGTNNFYRTSIDNPAHIYAKDFDNNGSLDAFPFYPFEDGNSYPKHTLDEMAVQYPNIRKKFRQYQSFSNAQLDDLFSQEEQIGMRQWSAHTFESSLFRNDGKGNFTQEPLPTETQFSEVHGIIPFDINEDGFLDLLITGNNYATDVATGRADASYGLTLLNDGNGKFKSLSPKESGFYVSGNSRGTYLLKHHDKTIVVSMLNRGRVILHQLK